MACFVDLFFVWKRAVLWSLSFDSNSDRDMEPTASPAPLIVEEDISCNDNEKVHCPRNTQPCCPLKCWFVFLFFSSSFLYIFFFFFCLYFWKPRSQQTWDWTWLEVSGAVVAAERGDDVLTPEASLFCDDAEKGDIGLAGACNILRSSKLRASAVWKNCTRITASCQEWQNTPCNRNQHQQNATILVIDTRTSPWTQTSSHFVAHPSAHFPFLADIGFPNGVPSWQRTIPTLHLRTEENNSRQWLLQKNK